MADLKLPTEEERQRQAYDLYAALGPKRSYAQVAQRLGCSLPTVKRLAKRYSWTKRIAEHEIQAARQAAEQTRATQYTEAEQNIKIAHGAKIKVAKAIAEGHVKPQFGDLARLIVLEEDLVSKRPAAPSGWEAITDPNELSEYARKLLLKILGQSKTEAIYREYLTLKGKLPAEVAEPAEPPPPEAATDEAEAAPGHPQGPSTPR